MPAPLLSELTTGEAATVWVSLLVGAAGLIAAVTKGLIDWSKTRHDLQEKDEVRMTEEYRRILADQEARYARQLAERDARIEKLDREMGLVWRDNQKILRTNERFRVHMEICEEALERAGIPHRKFDPDGDDDAPYAPRPTAADLGMPGGNHD